jgi:glycosyltransferase involved in cell wall biosynthesis
MDKINICVCTYKRAQLLKKCLLSLYAMKTPSHCEVTISVIDNHDEQSAKIVVDELKASSTIPTHYFSELNRGIPFARNRAIIETQNLGANFLVFIDDDEWVRKDWLTHLYEYCISRGGYIIISGDVIPELPADVPLDIKPFLYKKNIHPTGKKLSSCATNNVIFPTAISKNLGLQFDVSRPFSGGEDTIFFSTAARNGIRIEKCTEAIVHEHIPNDRATLKWLLKRKFWVGTVNAWRKQQKGTKWLSIFVSSLAQLLWHSSLTIVLTLVRQRKKRNNSALKASRSAGEFCGLFGYRVDSY